MADFPPVGNPQLLSQQFPNYSQVTTQAPGSGFMGGGMGMPGGFDMSQMAKFAQQMAAYKAAQAARQQAYARQQAEREFQFRQQQAEAQAGQEDSKMAFAREQWQALQDEKNRMVPVYGSEIGRGINATPGMSALSTRATPGAMAAGFVRASDAGQYSAPSQSQYQLGRTGGGPGAEWLGTGENRGTTAGPGQFDLSGNVVQTPAAQQVQGLRSDPFAEYDAYWDAVRAREAQQQPLMTSTPTEPDFSDVLGGAS